MESILSFAILISCILFFKIKNYKTEYSIYMTHIPSLKKIRHIHNQSYSKPIPYCTAADFTLKFLPPQC